MKVLVFAEQRGGEFRKAAIEAVCEGRRLAGDGELAAVVIGKGASDLGGQLAAYGPDRILAVDYPSLELYSTEGYTSVLQKAVEEENPDVILMAATAMGRDLAPRLGARLDVPVLADVVQLSWADGHLEAVRPVYGGKLLQKVRSKKSPGIATTRPKAFLPGEPDGSKSAEVKTLQVELSDADIRARTKQVQSEAEGLQVELSDADIRARTKQVQSEAEGMIELTEADFVVSGGRGLKGTENFKMLEDLAKVLGGAVGASRAAVDSGWRSHGDQVGQTGKVVAPTLYIHLAGMTSSKVIVAINKDPDAPIFKVADYGVVGDVMEVVPALTEAIKAVK